MFIIISQKYLVIVAHITDLNADYYKYNNKGITDATARFLFPNKKRSVMDKAQRWK